ncbi:MAG: major tail sheath protein [Candidatus Accumulibacter adjunctus]|uniref:Major tail sheath protein n=1 Tax=Candidatus Accumulibacter adjunctus TaxID=1454001 RepID=A0A011MDR6_9PROT|nr:MAG: major tail sheath protein [Candidatus Accumulibacter adjunctus]
MPEYLAPGVYVEETSYRAKSIEGVSTTTTGFVGPTRYGPIDMEPEIVTSLGDFERVYGDGQPLEFAGGRMHNYLWHAVRAFFEEGGRRLYVARTFLPLRDAGASSVPPLAADGRSFVKLPSEETPEDDAVFVKARFPGAAGDQRVSFRLGFGGNVLARRNDEKSDGPGKGTVRGLTEFDLVGIFGPSFRPSQAPLPPSIEVLRDALRALAATDSARAKMLASSNVESAAGIAARDAAAAAASARTLNELEDVVSAREAALLQAQRALESDNAEAIAATSAKELAVAAKKVADNAKKAAEDAATAQGAATGDAAKKATKSADAAGATEKALPAALKDGALPEEIKLATDAADSGKTLADAAKEAADVVVETLPVDATQPEKDAANTAAAKADESARAAKATVDTLATALKPAATPEQKTAATKAAKEGKEIADAAKVLADNVVTLLASGTLLAKVNDAAAAATKANELFEAAKKRGEAATKAIQDGEDAVAAITKDPDGLLAEARQARDAAKTQADIARDTAATSSQHALAVTKALEELTGIAAGTAVGRLYLARYNELAKRWEFHDSSGVAAFGEHQLDPDPKTGHKVCVATVTVTVVAAGHPASQWAGLPLDPRHNQAGEPDHLLARLGEKPGTLAAARSLPVTITLGKNLLDAAGQPRADGIALARLLFDEIPDIKNNDNIPREPFETRLNELKGGNDGQRPEGAEYEGKGDETAIGKTGLKLLEDLEDISIVAAPGITFGMEHENWRPVAQTINGQLLGHCERMRYRVAILDSGDGQSIGDVRSMRAKIDSARGHAALYYPWVRVLDPITRQEINLPPSGFVAGIYARNDVDRAVYKAPANEVVRSAIGFEFLLNKAQQEVLNPEGVNCLRFFEGRGFRLWGARTVSSDPEWKYVNVRRYFGYLERSIDKGTQWAVFEPNGEALWANVRRTIEDFLLNEWQSGALLGDKPEKAYFVRCDRSTMSQNDLDNGRLICLIGVAPLKPAEFVIFRIGQWTADRKI